MGRLLLTDLDEPCARPLSRFRSFFSFRNGILTPLERAKLRYPGSELFFRHPSDFQEKAIARVEELKSASGLSSGEEEIRSESIFPFLDKIQETIESDIELLGLKHSAHFRFNPSFTGSWTLGKESLFAHESALAQPGCVFNLENGPIILDAGSAIGSFSYLEGPLYIGKNCRIDNARITGGCVIGHECRIGGEVENTIINDCSNKHHEGFLGHSLVGSWVNLGALTTTSDLKNNYGEIRLSVPADIFPASREASLQVDTGRIKFGSIFGDCVKTAIGTMINTGSVIDAGSSIFGGNPGKYTKPLSWGLKETYDPDRFHSDCKKIFSRRKKDVPEVYLEIAKKLAGIHAKTD